MSERLTDQVALVTGGCNGIGRAVVDRFLVEGALVAVLDRTIAPLRDSVNDKLLLFEGDVRSFDDYRAAVEGTVDTFGRLDVFVGNAGVGDGFTPLLELDKQLLEAAFEELMAVNVKGLLLGAQATVYSLIETRGCMIFTLSNAAFYPDGGGPIYTASKHAGLGLVRQLAHELAPVVRVNGVAPGGTPSDLRLAAAFGLNSNGEALRAFDRSQSVSNGTAREGVGVTDEEDVYAMIRRVHPAGIVAEAEDHAGAYVLLASRHDGRAITGTVIETNAGLGVRGMRRVRGGDHLLT